MRGEESYVTRRLLSVLVVEIRRNDPRRIGTLLEALLVKENFPGKAKEQTRDTAAGAGPGSPSG
jgi:hypothetical protein